MDTTTRPKPRSPVRRLIQNPASSLLLTMLILFGVSRFFITYAQPRSVHVVRDHDAAGNTTLRTIDEDESSWDELARITQQRPDDLVGMHASDIGKTTGILYPTRESNRPTLVWYGEPFPATELPRVHSMVADWLDRKGWTNKAAMLRRDAPSTILWSGYAKNAGAVAVVCATVWSWGWLLQIPIWIRAARHKRGVCVQCKYDLSAAPHGPTRLRQCPECGSLNPSEAQAPDGST
jgi:hypothetical protein